MQYDNVRKSNVKVIFTPPCEFSYQMSQPKLNVAVCSGEWEQGGLITIKFEIQFGNICSLFSFFFFFIFINVKYYYSTIIFSVIQLKVKY